MLCCVLHDRTLAECVAQVRETPGANVASMETRFVTGVDGDGNALTGDDLKGGCRAFANFGGWLDEMKHTALNGYAYFCTMPTAACTEAISLYKCGGRVHPSATGILVAVDLAYNLHQ